MSARLPRIAVLIPSKNDEDFIATTLLSLFQEARLYRHGGGAVSFCIVNDGSTDGTASVIDGMRHLAADPFTFISRRQPRGMAYSLNEAFVACATNADLVLRVDSDARFIQSGWMARMAAFLTSDERVGMVAPLSVFPEGTIDTHGVNYLPRGRTIVGRDQEYATQTVEPITEVDALLGIYTMSRVQDWEIDVSYSAWRDDEDQSLAMRRRGRRCFVMGSLEVVHYHRLRWARVSDRLTITAWQRRHAPHRLQEHPTRWARVRGETELIAAAVLAAPVKKVIRRFVPRKEPLASPQSQEQAARLDVLRTQDSQHFAHKWGFPLVDAWSDDGSAPAPATDADIDALARCRAAHLFAARYTAEGKKEAREIIERHLRSTPQLVSR